MRRRPCIGCSNSSRHGRWKRRQCPARPTGSGNHQRRRTRARRRLLRRRASEMQGTQERIDSNDGVRSEDPAMRTAQHPTNGRQAPSHALAQDRRRRTQLAPAGPSQRQPRTPPRARASTRERCCPDETRPAAQERPSPPPRPEPDTLLVPESGVSRFAARLHCAAWRRRHPPAPTWEAAEQASTANTASRSRRS